MLPAAAAFCSSMAANPSKLNLAIQIGAFEVAAMKVLPDIEKDELTALAQVFTQAGNEAIQSAPQITGVPTAALVNAVKKV